MHREKASVNGFVRSSIAIFAAASLAGCGGSSGSNNAGGGGGCASTSPGCVGPAGGTVSTSNGPSVQVPPGALAVATEITVSATTTTPPGALGSMYQFGPDGTTFATPVQVGFPVPGGTDASTTTVWWTKQGSTSQWDVLHPSVSGTTATVSVNHFSGGGVFGCIDMTGAWLITTHCNPAYVGKTAVISQTFCSGTSADPVSGDPRTLTISKNDVSIPGICSGTVTGSTWNWTCAACVQVLVKQ